jgi:hypothetical protein
MGFVLYQMAKAFEQWHGLRPFQLRMHIAIKIKPTHHCLHARLCLGQVQQKLVFRPRGARLHRHHACDLLTACGKIVIG